VLKVALFCTFVGPDLDRAESASFCRIRIGICIGSQRMPIPDPAVMTKSPAVFKIKIHSEGFLPCRMSRCLGMQDLGSGFINIQDPAFVARISSDSKAQTNFAVAVIKILNCLCLVKYFKLFKEKKMISDIF
jgi:hypothetical protein